MRHEFMRGSYVAGTRVYEGKLGIVVEVFKSGVADVVWSERHRRDRNRHDCEQLVPWWVWADENKKQLREANRFQKDDVVHTDRKAALGRVLTVEEGHNGSQLVSVVWDDSGGCSRHWNEELAHRIVISLRVGDKVQARFCPQLGLGEVEERVVKEGRRVVTVKLSSGKTCNFFEEDLVLLRQKDITIEVETPAEKVKCSVRSENNMDPMFLLGDEKDGTYAYLVKAKRRVTAHWNNVLYKVVMGVDPAVLGADRTVQRTVEVDTLHPKLRQPGSQEFETTLRRDFEEAKAKARDLEFILEKTKRCAPSFVEALEGDPMQALRYILMLLLLHKITYNDLGSGLKGDDGTLLPKKDVRRVERKKTVEKVKGGTWEGEW